MVKAGAPGEFDDYFRHPKNSIYCQSVDRDEGVNENYGFQACDALLDSSTGCSVEWAAASDN